MKQYMINKRQYFILSFFLTRYLFLGVGFSVLVGLSKNSLLLASFLGMLLGYFLLYHIYKKGSIKKPLVVIISLCTLLTGILAITTLTGTFLLFDTPTLFIMSAFIIVLIYGSTKELKVTSRVSEIFFSFSIPIIIFGCSALMTLVNLYNLLPIFNASFWNFFKGIIAFAAMSLLPNLMLINYKDNLKFKDVSSGYILGSLLTILVIFFILGIYGSEFASIVRFPEYLILNKINIFNYISNVENILVMEWVFNLIIGGLICIKILIENLNIKLFATVIIFICLGTEFLLIRNYVNVLYYKRYFYCLAFILCLLSAIGKKKENQSN